MSDISKCHGTNCPLRDKCHRYTSSYSKPNQWYLGSVPYSDGKCEYFWDNANRVKVVKPDLACNPEMLID